LKGGFECHVEIELDPRDWVQEQEGVWVIVGAVHSPVLQILVLGLAAAGGAVQAVGGEAPIGVGDSAILRAVGQAGEFL
jgi:hypothetical protein